MRLWQRRIIGILTLVGGVVGASIAMTLLMSRGNPLEWIFCFVFAAAYAWGAWCGVRLLEKQPGAERAAVWYWLVQIPFFSSPIFGYSFASGFHLTAYMQMNPPELNGKFMLGSSFNYSLLQAEEPWAIGVNVFAVLVTWWLSRAAVADEA